MQRYRVGGTVTDGVYTSEQMRADYVYAQFYLEFYDAAGELVTPTGGTVSIRMSVDGDFFDTIEHGTIPADEAVNGDRITQTAMGLAEYASIELTGVTGADTFALTIARW